MQYFNCHTHQSSEKEIIMDLVNQYPWEFNSAIAFYSIGIHPWHISEDRMESDLKLIEEKLQTENCLALGECGLDKRIEIPFDLQEVVFEKQLLLAEKHQKPVIVHCVAAYQELIVIKKKLNIKVTMVVHGFSKNTQLAQQLLDNGFYLSFGKYLVRNPDLETVFKKIPDDLFFLETDTSEDSIEEVYALAAKYKNKTIAELQAQIALNFEKVFR